MLDEVANSVEFGGFVTGTSPDPDPGRYRRSPGIAQLKTEMPVWIELSELRQSVDIQQKLAESYVTPHLARGKTGGKVEPNGRWLGARLLDSTWIIGGKCELSNGSGKSPGLNQFAFCGTARLPLQFGWREILGDFFLFCAKHSHSREAQTFPEGRVGGFVR